jgi:hypothetical protein
MIRRQSHSIEAAKVGYFDDVKPALAGSYFADKRSMRAEVLSILNLS